MFSEFPNDDNGDVLRRLQREGDDLSKMRDINFSVVFPDAAKSNTFAKHFEQQGFRVIVRESKCIPELPWDVTVTNYMLPTYTGITEFEETLAEAALPFEGRNDGWGCFSQPTQH